MVGIRESINLTKNLFEHVGKGFTPELISKVRAELEYQKGDAHQAIMNVAYNEWQAKEHLHMDKQEFGELVEKQFGPMARLAIMLGNLHYQVYNGGFQQYYDNAYAGDDLTRHLRLIEYMNKFGIHHEDVDSILREFVSIWENHDTHEAEKDRDELSQQIAIIEDEISKMVSPEEYDEEYKNELSYQMDELEREWQKVDDLINTGPDWSTLDDRYYKLKNWDEQMNQFFKNALKN